MKTDWFKLLLNKPLVSRSTDLKEVYVVSISFDIQLHPLQLIYYFTYFSTGKEHTTVGWGKGGKIGKIIN